MTPTAADVGTHVIRIVSLVASCYQFLYNPYFLLTITVNPDPCLAATLITGTPTTTYSYTLEDATLTVSFDYFSWVPSSCTSAFYDITVDGVAWIAPPTPQPSFFTADVTSNLEFYITSSAIADVGSHIIVVKCTIFDTLANE